MTRAIRPVTSLGALALADLLGHWPSAEGPLYRLLATRIARPTYSGPQPGSWPRTGSGVSC